MYFRTLDILFDEVDILFLYLITVVVQLASFRIKSFCMSNVNISSDIQRLLREKEQLVKEEKQLKLMIEQVKKQITALQVEQLVVSNRVPLRVSPTEFSQQQEEESSNQELSLDVLNQMVRGTYEVEEEEED